MSEESKVNTSMQMRLQNVQNRLIAQKGSKNDFGRYNYRNVEDILSEIKPLLAENNLLLRLTDTLIDKCECVYIQSCAVITDALGAEIDQSGEPREIVSVAYAREPKKQSGMSDSQMTGTASSYARKYALGAMFLLSGEACPDYASQVDGELEKIKGINTVSIGSTNSIDSVQDKDKDKDKDKVKDKENVLLKKIKKYNP